MRGDRDVCPADEGCEAIGTSRRSDARHILHDVGPANLQIIHVYGDRMEIKQSVAICMKFHEDGLGAAPITDDEVRECHIIFCRARNGVISSRNRL
eukprot:6211010-Pleurochrysis_carterae.AAC.1